MTMKAQLRFGLSQINKHAPLWLVNATSIVALLLVAKPLLVTNLPITSELLKKELTDWTDYLLGLIQVLLAIGVILFGEQKATGQ